jgi:DNA ligase-associated metallophosphoesterase
VLPSRERANAGVEIAFAGTRLRLDASGALYWPAQKLLAAADLHFEKASFLAGAGHPVPPYDTRETLRNLAAVVEEYRPETLLLLGDSLHDANALARMAEADRTALSAIAARVGSCAWIEGNHDAAARPPSGWMVSRDREIAGLAFRHQPEPASELPQLVGHFHPKTSVRRRGYKISGRCFVATARMIVLPAFGAYTGGLDIAEPAFQAVLAGDAARVFLCRRGGIYDVSG